MGGRPPRWLTSFWYQVLVVALDRDRSERVRRMWPFLRDRRIDHFQDLVLRYRDRT